MRPISLKFRAFGPYKNEQIVDFAKFSNAGLFLICGETGSGKTVILDAMTYALYGKSSGGIRGEITNMRCQIAPPDLSTEVEFTFEIHGRRYKFTRSIKQGRKNLSVSQNALILNDSGVFEPLFENPKIKSIEDKATQLLGLNYEQFRQVIILPQGQFERLLIAKSSEKEEILVSLFGAEKWQKIADYISSKVNDEKRRLENERLDIDRTLGEKECQSFEELVSLLNLKTETLMLKEKEFKKVSKDLDKEKKAYEVKANIFEKYNNLENFKLKFKALEKQKTYITELKGRLEKASNADTLKPIFDNLETEAKLISNREKDLQNKTKKLLEIEKHLSSATQRINKLNSLVSENEQNKKRLSKLSDMTDFYTKIDKSQSLSKEAEKDYISCFKAVEKETKAVALLANEKTAINAKENHVYDEYTQMLSNYMANISGTLAKKLEVNKPCPVCGSITHPSPAKTIESFVTNEMLDNKNNEIEKIRKNLKDKTDELDKATDILNKQKDTLNNALVKKENLNAEYQNLLKNIDTDIKNILELNKAISDLSSKISNFEKELKEENDNFIKLQKDYDILKSAISVLEDEFKKENKNYDDLKLSFEEKLSKLLFVNINDFKDSLLEKPEKLSIEKQIRDYEIEYQSVLKNISEISKELENKEKPDLSELKNKLSIIEQKNSDLKIEIALISKEITDLIKISSSLEKRIRKFEIDDKKCRENQIFARHLNGVNGVSLQRYVLGVMLSSVTIEANRLLENVHGGRYKLFRTLDTTGTTRKAGLELEVFDSLSGERRSVVSLSGGEKFLVALSLSIGLSAVVQAQSGGIRLDAMFIDEGFGSLDSSSIGDSLMILSHMKKTNGLVGIISHVATLKENIDAKIEVFKAKDGSSLKIRV